MKDRVFGILQRVGRSFMLPIAILPVAGLLLGIGSSLSNETMLSTYGLLDLLGPGTAFFAVVQVMKEAGNILFVNLPILFAIGVAIGMSRKQKEVAALAAVIAFLSMHASIGALLQVQGTEYMLTGAVTSVCGIQSLQLGVFGGIIVGMGVASLHNRFYRIQLPQVLSFFEGTRFVPIISALVYTGVGILMFYIWPVFQRGIYMLGDEMMRSGYVGTWVYGCLERLLLPFGLHHIFTMPFWQTAVGGKMIIDSVLVEGAQNIFFAQLADPDTQHFAVSATRFMSGKFPLMIFGLPGAALAMYHTAFPERKKAVAGLLFSAALTSMLTGITEPLEFAILFAAPLLYALHCAFAGLAYMLMHMLNVGVGMTFSGGLIDLFLFGILQGNEKTNWVWIVIVGIGYFFVYYVMFYMMILRFDLKTPGRTSDEEDAAQLLQETEVVSVEQKAVLICRGLGGRSNISDFDCCATRLRCTVYRSNLVREELLRASGATGVIRSGNGVQIIYGPQVGRLKEKLDDYLEGDWKVKKRSSAVKKRSRSEESKMAEAGVVRRHKNASYVICSPMTGTAAVLSETPDKAFAEKIVGDGVMILPSAPEVRAPEDGQIRFLFATKHAVGMRTDSGLDLLIHVGIETVKLGGNGFEAFVQNGQKVKKGDLLLRADLEYLKAHAPSLATPVLCTKLEEGQQIRLLKTGPVQAGEPLFEVFYKEEA